MHGQRNIKISVHSMSEYVLNLRNLLDR